MARLLFEKQGIRRRLGPLASGVTFVVYTDAAGTALADISATVGASATSSSTVDAGTSAITTADIAGLGPAALKFYGPDAVDTLYLRCPADPTLGVQEIEADEDERLDALEAGGGGSVATHEADTTSIHGITDTSQLETLNTTQTVSAQKTYTADQLFRSGRPWVDVRAYGTDTTAIDTAWAAAVAAGAPLYFPRGTDYTYSGSGLDGLTITILGAGRDLVTITLGSGVYLVKPTAALGQTHISGLKTVGGKGLFQHTFTGVNVQRLHTFRDLWLKDYTECGISSEASDMPYFRVLDCVFDSLDDDNTIGVALPYQADNSRIMGNAFLRNRIDVKLRQAGVSQFVRNNDFIHFAATPTAPRARIWCVPHTSAVNGGKGLVIAENKFGNEQQDTTDYEILYADEGAGATNSVKMPTLSSDSTGIVVGHSILDNKFSLAGAAGARPLVYSTTPNVRGINMHDNILDGTPSYIVQFRTPPVNDRTVATSSLGPFLTPDLAVEVLGVPITNSVSGLGMVVDPLGQFDTALGKGHLPQVGGQSPAGYVNLLTTGIRAWTNAFTLTRTNVTDAVGGADASEITFTSATYTHQVLATSTAGRPAFVDFDLQAGSTSGLDRVEVTVEDFTPNPDEILVRRVVGPPAAGWAPYRIPLIFGTGTATMLVKFRAPTGSSGNLQIGRVRVYHASEPVNTDGLEFAESPGDWAAPAANRVRIYLKDNGSGKTQLVARFPTGPVQQLAIEP